MLEGRFEGREGGGNRFPEQEAKQRQGHWGRDKGRGGSATLCSADFAAYSFELHIFARNYVQHYPLVLKKMHFLFPWAIPA